MKHFQPKSGRAETIFFRFSDIAPSKRQGGLRRLVGMLRKRWHYHQLVRDLPRRYGALDRAMSRLANCIRKVQSRSAILKR